MFSEIKKGDKVHCLQFQPLHDSNGDEIHNGLKQGGHYTIKNSYILTVELEEIPGMFLKEYFRKLPSK